jgi:hypothetical protein
MDVDCLHKETSSEAAEQVSRCCSYFLSLESAQTLHAGSTG